MKNKKAISLIVLIITIIVMIILASAIIMSLDNANIFNKAEEAVNKTNAATNKYLSEIKLAERELEKIQGPSKVTDTTPGTLSGKGTPEEPYLIESIEDLVAFSNEVDAGRTFEGEIVKLTRLLDFNSDNSYANHKENAFGDVNGDKISESTLKKELTTGAGFEPIGNFPVDDKETYFKGTFDGDGAEIRNLYIDASESSDFVGFFSYAEDANFKNLGITGIINGSNSSVCGGIIASLNVIKGASITNSYTKIQFKETNFAGCIVGIVETYDDLAMTLIQDCYNVGNIINENTVEGGSISGIVSIASQTKINRCYNTGNLTYKKGGVVARDSILCR